MQTAILNVCKLTETNGQEDCCLHALFVSLNGNDRVFKNSLMYHRLVSFQYFGWDPRIASCLDKRFIKTVLKGDVSSVKMLELSSKRPETQENWRAGSQEISRRGRGLSAAQASDLRPAERPFEAALAAQTTDDTRRAIYTLRRASERVSEPPEKKKERKMC